MPNDHIISHALRSQCSDQWVVEWAKSDHQQRRTFVFEATKLQPIEGDTKVEFFFEMLYDALKVRRLYTLLRAS